VKKSLAPLRIASIAISSLIVPETMMNGMSSSVSCKTFSADSASNAGIE